MGNDHITIKPTADGFRVEFNWLWLISALGSVLVFINLFFCLYSDQRNDARYITRSAYAVDQKMIHCTLLEIKEAQKETKQDIKYILTSCRWTQPDASHPSLRHHRPALVQAAPNIQLK